MITKSYVDVLVPLPLDRPTFTYLLEDDHQWHGDQLIGKLVLVPFGRGRTVTGIIVRILEHDAASPDIRYKRVLHIFPYPPISSTVLQTWQWAAEYYMCSPGDVLRAAIPAAFRPDGEQRYAFVDPDDFEDEDLALFADRHPRFTMRQLRSEFPECYPVLLMGWIEKDQVYLEEEVGVGCRPGIRRGWGISLPMLRDEGTIERLREKYKRSKGVLRAIGRMVDLYEEHAHDTIHRLQSEPLTLSGLSEMLEVGIAVITKLRVEGLVVPVEVEDQGAEAEVGVTDLPPLSQEKGTTIPDFQGCSILLHHSRGGMPEDRLPLSYIHAMLSTGHQVLLLCPSASVLDQMRPLLAYTFGPFLKEYHTSVSLTRRKHIWLDALRGSVGLYVGLRGTAWLPLCRLGAVVIHDEEDRGYRQFEPAPRFTASRLAMILAHYSGAQTLLTSLAPSVESMLLAVQGRYAFSVDPVQQREIDYRFVSLSDAFEKNKVQGRLLTFEMAEAVQSTLSEGGIALLFYQRKGFAKQISCTHCHYTPQCPVCHSTYRFYQESARLVCPVCGHHEHLPSSCPSCGRGTLRLVGTGVERLASAIRRLYPGIEVAVDPPANIGRTKGGIIISTAYDAPYVWLLHASMIGVVQLELMTMISDFRANERTYQMLTKSCASAPHLRRMVVQYLSSQKPNALEAFEQQSYRLMLDHELEERHIVRFPPFARQADLIIQSGSQLHAYHFGEALAAALRQALGEVSVMGPTPLPPHKKATDIGYRLTLLIPLSLTLSEVRQRLKSISDSCLSEYRGPRLFLYFDIDPS